MAQKCQVAFGCRNLTSSHCSLHVNYMIEQFYCLCLLRYQCDTDQRFEVIVSKEPVDNVFLDFIFLVHPVLWHPIYRAQNEKLTWFEVLADL